MTIALTDLAPYGLPTGAYVQRGTVLFVDLSFELKVGGHAPVDFAYPELSQEVQQDNGDTRLIITVLDADGAPVDLSRASFIGMKIKYPDLAPRDVDASFITDGTDGKIYFTTENETLDQAGYYFLQAIVNVGNARKTTRWGTFRVGEDVDTDDL